MQQVVTGTIIFITLVIVIELLIYTYKNIRSPDRAKIIKRLRKSNYIEDKQIDTEILKKRVFSEILFLNRLLLKTPGMLKLDQLISQANAKYQGCFVHFQDLALRILRGYKCPDYSYW